MKYFTLLLSTLLLVACDKPAETSVVNASEASASATAPAQMQTLSSKDGALEIRTKGSFQDQSNNEALLPEGFTADEISLLQQDENSGIVVYAVNLGEPKQAAREYFAQLKQRLEAEPFSQLSVGAATENRMDYAFTQDNGISEHCVAIYTNKALYNVCANSTQADAKQIADTLNDIKLLQP